MVWILTDYWWLSQIMEMSVSGGLACHGRKLSAPCFPHSALLSPRCWLGAAHRESMSTFSGWSKWCGSCRTWCGTCRKGITKMCAKGQGAQLHRIMWTSYGSLAAQSWLLLLGQTVHRCSSLRECFGSCEYNLIPDNCYEWNLLFQNNILQQPSNMVVTFW